MSSTGNLLVSDVGNNLIRSITPAGIVYVDSVIYSMVVCLTVCLYVSMTVCLFVCLFVCMFVCLYLCISDCLFVVGNVTTVFGSTFGFVDGSGTNARFNGPYDIIFDDLGNLYVADSRNNVIRKIEGQGMSVECICQ